MKTRLAALTFILILPLPGLANQCGEVTIADMNWNSASFMAHLDQFVLRNVFDCDAQLIPGDTMPTGTSMVEKNEPDIAPEFWSNSMREALDNGVAQQRLSYAGVSLSDGGEEGFWVPDYLVEQYPEMANIEGVIKHAALFKHPEGEDSFAFYGCPAGWTCQLTAGHLFDALNLEQAGFTIIDPGSGAGLAGTIAKAYERKQPWFGYYWAPTPVLGKYPMVKVEFGQGSDQAHYNDCISQVECDEPRPIMYPPSLVQTVTTYSFASKAPEANAYLGKRSFTNQQMNALLAWMEDNQADGDYAMEYFLKEFPELWKVWFNPQQIEKLNKALAAL
ncbi:ABC transporter substrate-binding protein [Alginatibacterium sediminis]|uniref:ABC transporter substrate-binding protein n=1 Tax=Alginatibacterium sediminis TaxID=2164068 RepID=A0A420EHR7_9ALTE|nr:ABC transporter substrate-binding protein [Alginatibacterium sediminis]RKF20200.1 ABC transporter substrate-binding protein [Alginatibacterium sediminis]